MRTIKRWGVLLLALWPSLGLAELKVQTREAAGLTYWLVEDHHVPVIELRLFFKQTGYISDSPDQQGRAALAAASMKEGAGEYDAQAFAEELEAHAIEMSVFSGRDGLQVSMKTLAEHRDKAFALLSDLLLRPRYSDTSLQKIKRQMAVYRARQKESPHYLAERAYVEHAYRGHPYAQQKLGSADSMAALSRKDVMHYHRTQLAKDNAVLAIAGAIPADEADELIETALAELPARRQASNPAGPVTFPPQPFEQSVEINLPQTLLLFAREGVARTDARFYAAYLLNHMLGGGTLTSYLGEEVRKKRGLSYGISTALEPALYATRWAGDVQTQHETADKTRRVINATLSDLAQKGVSTEELQAAKDYVIGSFPLQIDSNAGIASYLLSMQLYDLGADYFSKRNDYFESVTLAQVNQLAAEWLPANKWSWVMVGPETSDEHKVNKE